MEAFETDLWMSPLLIAEDFNSLLMDDDKKGGHRPNSPLDCNFRDWVLECDLVDLGFQGPKFTWFKEDLMDVSIGAL